MDLPDAARHMADLLSKLNDAINQVESDPDLSKVTEDPGDAWLDIVKVGKDLA